MKKLLFLISILLWTLSGYSDNESLYLFRNDNDFNSFKLKDILGIQYKEADGVGFDRMTISTYDNAVDINLDVIDSCVVRTHPIPDIYIQLDPPYDEIEDLIKNLGKSYIYQATIRMDGNGMYEDLPEQKIELRGRGNSTWGAPKTPYRFKLSNKTSVAGMPAAKTFVLIANFIDPTLMRNVVALWTAKEIGLPFSNSFIPVNVYLNGGYRGSYMMTEKIGIGKGSVNIAEETGMLFELDANYDEDYKFMYQFKSDSNKKIPVMIKDPDISELFLEETQRNAYFAQWKDDFSKMADAIVSLEENLHEYIDIEEAAKYLLVNNIALNMEIRHPKSVFLYKNSLGNEDVYHFGPVWDFDWGFGYNYDKYLTPKYKLVGGDLTYNGGTFFSSLARNKQFQETFKKIWDDFYINIYPRMLTFMDQYQKMIEPSAKLNGLRWPENSTPAGSSFDTEAQYTKFRQWIIDHIEWCNSQPNYGLY